MQNRWILHRLMLEMIHRDRAGHRHQHRRSNCDGSYRQPCLWSGNGRDADCPRDRPLHPPNYRRGCLPRGLLLHHRIHPRLRLAGRRHLPHRYHRRQRTRGTPCHRHR